MVIGIDASRANRDHKTGTEWYSYYIIRWLAKLDSQNQYILYTDKPLSGGLLDLTTDQYFENTCVGELEYDKDGYQVIKSPNNNFKGKVLNWPFGVFWTLGRLSLEMIIKRPDVLYIPAHSVPLIMPARTINTIHDIGFERDRMLYRNEQMGAPDSPRTNYIIDIFVRLFTLNKYSANSLDYLSWSTKYSLKHASDIIVVSNFTKQEIKDIYDGKTDKIKVIHNGYNRFLYDSPRDQNKIKEIMDKYDITGPYILYVGRLEKKKNTPALIEAYAKLKDRHPDLKQKLFLVGDASYGFDEVKYLIKEFSLDFDVIIPGWADEADLPHIFKGASVFVFPTRYEGFGIPLLQAMASGIPIAASMAASIPEVVGDAAELFNPTDIDSITDAIEKILYNEEYKNDLINKGLKRITEFSWEKTARKTLDLLNKKK